MLLDGYGYGCLQVAELDGGRGQIGNAESSHAEDLFDAVGVVWRLEDVSFGEHVLNL